ncbi:hypothetical protein pb186bvf_013006 [Paramecium bursaria]
MYKGLIELPECCLCLEILLKDLCELHPCRHILHSHCGEPLARAKSKCPLCNTKIKEAKQLYFNGEEHDNLNKKEIIPLCVTQTIQQYEARIQMLQKEKEELQRQEIEMRREMEMLRMVNNTGILDLVKAYQENESKVQQYQQTIEELTRKQKDKNPKQQEPQMSTNQPLRNINTRVETRLTQRTIAERGQIQYPLNNRSKEQKDK